MPDGTVHLADRRGRGGPVVEFGEAESPVRAEIFREHLVDGRCWQGRRRLLQLGQRRAVGAGDLRRQRSLEDRECLPELERSALELAENPEDLLRGPLLQLLRDDLSRPAAEPLAQAERGAAGHSHRQGG